MLHLIPLSLYVIVISKINMTWQLYHNVKCIYYIHWRTNYNCDKYEPSGAIVTSPAMVKCVGAWWCWACAWGHIPLSSWTIITGHMWWNWSAVMTSRVLNPNRFTMSEGRRHFKIIMNRANIVMSGQKVGIYI